MQIAVTFGLVWQIGASPSSAAPNSVAQTSPGITETANFRVVGLFAKADAAWVGAQLEAQRRRLCETWLEHEPQPWSPKCDVVVHATATAYAKAVGPNAFATLGATTIDFARGEVSRRRIDVRADRPGWFAAVLPHELTHVIMADEFPAGEVPHWADEGMAILADSTSKQALHRRDFDQARRSRTTFQLAQLLSQACYPSAKQIPVFYGQSAALVRFLVERKSPAAFVRFLHRGAVLGCDRACGEVYGWISTADLERAWYVSLRSPRDARPPFALTGGSKPANRT